MTVVGWLLVVQHGIWRELYSERVIEFKADVCQLTKVWQFTEILNLSRNRCIPRRTPPDSLTYLSSYNPISYFSYRG